MRPEGGLGDTIQFIRYAQRLKSLGATVIARVQNPLRKLLANVSGIDGFIETNNKIPHFDATATMMSLPAIFYDTESTFPSDFPYITADQELVAQWGQQLATDTNFKIGICWQADVHNDVSRLPVARRGIPLQCLHQLATIPGVSIYSLQKGDGVEQLADLPDNITINGRLYSDHINNFQTKT